MMMSFLRSAAIASQVALEALVHPSAKTFSSSLIKRILPEKCINTWNLLPTYLGKKPIGSFNFSNNSFIPAGSPLPLYLTTDIFWMRLALAEPLLPRHLPIFGFMSLKACLQTDSKVDRGWTLQCNSIISWSSSSLNRRTTAWLVITLSARVQVIDFRILSRTTSSTASA